MCESYVLREQKNKGSNKKNNTNIQYNDNDAHFKIDLTSNRKVNESDNNGWKKPKIIFNNSD